MVFRPEVGGGGDWNDFEVHEVVPRADPGAQQFRIRRFHELETASARRVNPACVVGDAVGQHAAALLETFADGFRIAMLEAFNDHEEHGAEFTPRGRGRE